MTTSTTDKVFRLSQLDKIVKSDINSEDSLLISDKSNDGKWYSKRLTVSGLTDFLSSDPSMTNMVDGKILSSAEEGGVLRPVISSAVSSIASIQKWQDRGGVEELESGAFQINGGDASSKF